MLALPDEDPSSELASKNEKANCILHDPIGPWWDQQIKTILGLPAEATF